MAIGKPPGLTPLEGSVLAVNDAIRIGGFLLWGLAGLAPAPGQAKPQPLAPKATSRSRSGLRPMEAQTQGQKSHYGITRKSEFLNHFWGTAARLLGPT